MRLFGEATPRTKRGYVLLLAICYLSAITSLITLLAQKGCFSVIKGLPPRFTLYLGRGKGVIGHIIKGISNKSKVKKTV